MLLKSVKRLQPLRLRALERPLRRRDHVRRLHRRLRRHLAAAGESVIKLPSPLNVLNNNYDRSDEYEHLMTDSAAARHLQAHGFLRGHRALPRLPVRSASSAPGWMLILPARTPMMMDGTASK